MTFRVVLSNRSEKFLKAASKPLYERVVKALESLSEDPLPRDTKRIIGRIGVFRIRVGDYRVLYEIYFDKKVVFIVNIDKRARAYR